jgi:hypothetical protein
LKRYPQLEAAKIFDALAFALDNPEVMEADIARESELIAKRERDAAGKSGSPTQIELPFAGSADSESESES